MSKMIEYGVKPEIECFDLSHIYGGINLWKRGLILDPPWFDMVMNVTGSSPEFGWFPNADSPDAKLCVGDDRSSQTSATIP